MSPVALDTNTANQIASITASLAALFSAVSVIISGLALRRSTKQTNILTKQFEAAELAHKESLRPRLAVEISEYKPPDSGQMRGDVGFILRNAGGVSLHVVRVRTQSGNTQNQDVDRSIEVHPGYPVETVVNILPPDGFNPPILKAWFEIETRDGLEHLHVAEWELQRSLFVLLKSGIIDK
jgi:hypothetical protein